jgi:hypothetical protein
MAKWYRHISNALLAVAAICAGLAIVTGSGWLDRPGLTAHPPALALGEVAAGDTLPVSLTLRNHTSKPIRIVGAEAT